MLTHTGTHTIETERLILRRFTLDDAEDMYLNWASDDEVTKYLRLKTHINIEETKAYLTKFIELYENLNRYLWAIQKKEGECIGAIGAFIDERDLKAEIAYNSGKNYWNNGYITEAVGVVIEYLFNNVGVNRVEAYHSINNPASGRVMQKAGMVKEGQSKQKYYCRMGFQDCDLYGIVKEDYNKNKPKFDNSITIETKRLLLRPFNKDDFEANHSYASVPENVKYMIWGPNDEKATRDFLAKAEENWKETPITQFDFAIVLKDNGAVIGGGGIYLNKDRNEGMLGWILHRDYWKQGICTEFAKALLKFGFEDLKLHRIYATCNTKNYGSYHVMEKCCMRREAHFIKNRFGRVDNQEVWYDEYHYAILDEEWMNNNGL